MTTYIGRIGDMVPTVCVSDLSESHEQRVTFGGGEGTHAPLRARVNGVGGRTWAMSKAVCRFNEGAPLWSLARMQARLGGAYRVIPCDAVDHNMLTPQSSEELRGWTNVAWTWRVSYPDLDGAWADSVIPLTIPFVIGGTGGLMAAGRRPSGVGKIEQGDTSEAPVIPVIKAGPLFDAAYVSGTGTLRVRHYDADGDSTLTTQPFAGTPGVLQRVKVSATPPAGTVSQRIEVAATSTDVYLAWPSHAHKDNEYTHGRGCDKAWMSLPDRRVIATWGEGIESLSWQVREVGV